MHRVTVTQELDHDIADAWNVLDDFGTVYKYNPAVESSELLSTEPTGLNAARVCHFYDGTSLKETIVRYQPGRGYSFELSDFAMPLKQARAHFELTPLTGDRCRVAITLEFSPKFGPVGWLMGKLMIRPTLRKALRELTKGLDDHMRTGRVVGQGGALLEAAA